MEAHRPRRVGPHRRRARGFQVLCVARASLLRASRQPSLCLSPLAASAYSPPELAQRLFIKTDQPLPLLAHPSFDAWGFGVVLYEALTGEILFRRHVSNDNIQDPAEQSQLCMWRSINAKLLSKIVADDPADEPAYEAGRNLVAWCL